MAPHRCRRLTFVKWCSERVSLTHDMTGLLTDDLSGFRFPPNLENRMRRPEQLQD